MAEFGPDDFTKPDGDLPPERFPDVELQVYLKKWILRGEEKVEQWLSAYDYHDDPPDAKHESFPDPKTPRRKERAIEAFVYWKAWDHVHERLTGEAKRQETETWSASFSDAQIDSYRQRAEDAKDEFERLVSGDDSLQGDDEIRSVQAPANLVP